MTTMTTNILPAAELLGLRRRVVTAVARLRLRRLTPEARQTAALSLSPGELEIAQATLRLLALRKDLDPEAARDHAELKGLLSGYLALGPLKKGLGELVRKSATGVLVLEAELTEQGDQVLAYVEEQAQGSEGLEVRFASASMVYDKALTRSQRRGERRSRTAQRQAQALQAQESSADRVLKVQKLAEAPLPGRQARKGQTTKKGGR